MPPVPTGDASLTLAEGEVEVARGTAVTRGSLEAHPAGALTRVLVTVTVQHSGAGTLARCGRGGRRGQSRAGCLCPWGQGRGGAGLLGILPQVLKNGSSKNFSLSQQHLPHLKASKKKKCKILGPCPTTCELEGPAVDYRSEVKETVH